MVQKTKAASCHLLILQHKSLEMSSLRPGDKSLLINSFSDNFWSAYLLGNYDKAWNDPPIFAYTTGLQKQEGVQATSKRTQLNKRVAFPITGNITSVPHANSLVLPSPPIPPLPCDGTAPIPKVTNITEIIHSKESTAQSESGLSCLENVLKIFQGKQISYVEGENKVDEISKRLENMANSWRKGKLNNDICQRLTTLSECLKTDRINDEQFSSAMEIVQSLACDYSTECVGWIMGIKHLIFKIKESSL